MSRLNRTWNIVAILVFAFLTATTTTGLAKSTDTITEEFNSSSGFTQTDPDVYIANGKVYWTIHRDEGQQYVYRSIPEFSGDVRLTVSGQIDSWTNNCQAQAGIGDSLGNNMSVNFGFFGGGCSTNGPVITASGASLDYYERDCVFTGNWLWVSAKTPYTAVLTLQGGNAELSVPGVGTARGTPTYNRNYNTLYVGFTGGGDYPQCSGTIERMVIEPLSTPTCYTLTTAVNPSGSGTVSTSTSPNCAGGKYTAGTQVTLTANPASGYSFSGWSGALSGSQNPKLLTIDGDKSVTANFSQYLIWFFPFISYTE